LPVLGGRPFCVQTQAGHYAHGMTDGVEPRKGRIGTIAPDDKLSGGQPGAHQSHGWSRAVQQRVGVTAPWLIVARRGRQHRLAWQGPDTYGPRDRRPEQRAHPAPPARLAHVYGRETSRIPLTPLSGTPLCAPPCDVSSLPITTGPVGTQARYTHRRRRQPPCKAGQRTRLSTRWSCWKCQASACPITRRTDLTGRFPGARVAPTISRGTCAKRLVENIGAKAPSTMAIVSVRLSGRVSRLLERMRQLLLLPCALASTCPDKWIKSS
jgi:hypothetical protein